MELNQEEKALVEKLVKKGHLMVNELNTEECVAMLSLLHTDWIDRVDVKWETIYTDNPFKDLSWIRLKLPEREPVQVPKEEPGEKPEVFEQRPIEQSSTESSIYWDRVFLMLTVVLLTIDILVRTL